jgi:hypothetical protein
MGFEENVKLTSVTTAADSANACFGAASVTGENVIVSIRCVN